MLNFILLFLIMVMPSPFSQADNIDESLFEYFPEGYYSSIAYTDMKFVDQMVTLVGDVMPQYSRDAYLEVLPPGFCKSAEKVLFPLYGDNLEVVFVVSHKDPLSALKTSLKKKEAVLTDQKVLGKNVFQFITKPNRIGKRDTIYFILFETNTILGSTNPELIVKMVETKEGQHLNIFAGRYYKEFRKMFPELGGVVLAHFQEEDIVEAIERTPKRENDGKGI